MQNVFFRAFYRALPFFVLSRLLNKAHDVIIAKNNSNDSNHNFIRFITTITVITVIIINIILVILIILKSWVRVFAYITMQNHAMIKLAIDLSYL